MDGQQRMSSMRASLELLPHIKTSEDKAEEWLERGKTDKGVDVDAGDLGTQKVPKTYQMLGVKRDAEFRWDLKSGKGEDKDSATVKEMKKNEFGARKR